MPTPLQLSQANRIYGYFQIDSNGDALFPNGALGLSGLTLSSIAQFDKNGLDESPRLIFNTERDDGASTYQAYIQAYIEDTSGAGYIAIGASDSAGEASLVFNGSSMLASAVEFDIDSNVHILGSLQIDDIPTGVTETSVLVVDAFGNVKLRSDFVVTYTNATPVPTTIGGIAAGSTFSNQTMQQMWDALLYPYQAPAFSSFSMSGQSTTVEVGTSISGTKTFSWSTSNSTNVQANSISIVDITNSTTLATGLSNDGTESILLPSAVIKNSAVSNTWRITGTNSVASNFSANFVVNWYWKIYYGTSSNTTLSEAQIEALTNGVLRNGITGSFSFAAGDYKYFSYPDAYGSINTIKDAATLLNVAMASNVDDAFFSNSANGIYYGLVAVTNVNGVSTNYRVYRTKNILGGSITIITT
jgi:hypothetical protein